MVPTRQTFIVTSKYAFSNLVKNILDVHIHDLAAGLRSEADDHGIITMSRQRIQMHAELGLEFQAHQYTASRGSALPHDAMSVMTAVAGTARAAPRLIMHLPCSRTAPELGLNVRKGNSAY